MCARTTSRILPAWSFGIALLVLIAANGCKKKTAESTPPGQPKPMRGEPPGYFQTHFQEESQFIVENIAADLSEMIYFAKHRRLPPASDFSVSAAGAAGAPTYRVRIVLDAKTPPLESKLAITGPIWSAGVYQSLVADLAQAVALERPAGAKKENDATLLLALAKPTAEGIEEEDANLSAALEENFTDALLHEKAGLLLAAFTLREHSGDFFDIRWPLGRITAHLAFARFLSSEQTVNGQVADAALETLVNNQASALQMLGAIHSPEPAVANWLRALQARNTGDYRPLAATNGLTLLERIEWFRAMAYSVSPEMAWAKLGEKEPIESADFCRIANQENFGVGLGHVLLQLSVRLEMAETGKIYELAHQKSLDGKDAVKALNELPSRCFSGEGQPRVQVIGWGNWAAFFQRQLCQALRANYDFMARKWGVPDQAEEFSRNCNETFGGLRFYPFLRRFNCATREECHKSTDDGFRITVATPHLSPPQCWNYLCYRALGERYSPNPNPHINEWHKHNPPPGTAYNLEPRLNHPSLINGAGAAQRLDALLAMAPHDKVLKTYLVNTRYKHKPDFAQAMALFQPILDYSTYAMFFVANRSDTEPVRREELILKAAAIDPDYYFDLASSLGDRDRSRALQYFEKAVDSGADSLHMASVAQWAIDAYLATGQKEKARRIADAAGEVYSAAGLEAKARFLEATGDPAGAFEWLVKYEERYDQSGPLLSFCNRYKEKAGDTRFDEEGQKRLKRLFPRGVEKVTLASFTGAPNDGVIVREENRLTREAGLKLGDVIVATCGIRVQNFEQYDYARDSSDKPELILIVWQGGAYREIRASPPNHRFSADFGTYIRQR